MIHNRFDAVLFDLDGTLLDTAPDFTTAINRVLDERGLEMQPESRVRNAVTHGSAGLITSVFGINSDHPDFEPLRQRLLHHYRQCLAELTHTFAGIDAVLEQLAARQIPWGIVTNKPVQYTTPILAQLSFPSRPATVICPEHVTRTKPDPESILLACRELHVAPERAIYVGDHLRDIEAGRNAGTTTAAVTWGYLDADEDPRNWGADHTVDNGNELFAILF